MQEEADQRINVSSKWASTRFFPTNYANEYQKLSFFEPKLKPNRNHFHMIDALIACRDQRFTKMILRMLINLFIYYYFLLHVVHENTVDVTKYLDFHQTKLCDNDEVSSNKRSFAVFPPNRLTNWICLKSSFWSLFYSHHSHHFTFGSFALAGAAIL